MIRHTLGDGNVAYPTKEKRPELAGLRVKLAVRSSLVLGNGCANDNIVGLTIKFNKRGVRTTDIALITTDDKLAEFAVDVDLTGATQAQRDYVARLHGY